MPNFAQAKCHENLFSMAEAQPKLSKLFEHFRGAAYLRRKAK
jgi:hypothetical protein